MTLETGVSQVISFLNVLSDNGNNILKSTRHHKSTYSGIFVTFNRVYKANNTGDKFHDNIIIIKIINDTLKTEVGKLLFKTSQRKISWSLNLMTN